MSKEKRINEATGAGVSSGKYSIPMSPGIRLFDKKQLEPFTVPTSKYDDAELAYDSYDGQMDVSKKDIKKIESKARKISKYVMTHPTYNDDDGDTLNQGPGTVKEWVEITPNVVSEDLANWLHNRKSINLLERTFRK